MNASPIQDGQAPAPVGILYIIDQLCALGGAERMLLNTVRMLPAKRFSASIVTFKVAAHREILNDFPCPVHVLPLQKTYDWNAFRVATRLRGLLKKKQIAIVHTFFETSDLWAGLLAKLSGCPILVSSRRDMGILRSAKHNLAYRVLRAQFDAILTVSEAVRIFTMDRDGVPAHKVRTLHNGLDLRSATPSNGSREIRKLLGISPTAPVVVTVGHIRRVKGVDVLLRAAATVCNVVPTALFLVIGEFSEPDYCRELQELTEKLGISSNVRFLGEVANIYPLLQESDIFCLPSRSEGFSNALIEAMACRLPCVATRVGGNAEALEDGRTGYLVGNEDANAMAHRILHLLNDRETGRHVGEAARLAVEERFSIQAMMHRLTAVYEELLALNNV